MAFTWNLEAKESYWSYAGLGDAHGAREPLIQQGTSQRAVATPQMLSFVCFTPFENLNEQRAGSRAIHFHICQPDVQASKEIRSSARVGGDDAQQKWAAHITIFLLSGHSVKQVRSE